MREAPYTARDVADLLGISVETFYARRRSLQEIDRMPAPLSSLGRHKWHRGSIDAWLERHHPNHVAGAIANDNAPRPAPASTAEHQAHLRNVYGGLPQ